MTELDVSRLPRFAGLEEFIRHLDRLIALPPRKRGAECAVLLLAGRRADDAELIVELQQHRLRTTDGQPLVPHAVVDDDGSAGGNVLRQIKGQLARSMPGGTGQLRWRQYRLLRRITEAELGTDDEEDAPRALREAVYANWATRALPGRLLAWAATADPATWWQKLLQPAFGAAPRALYWRFVSIRMARRGGWYGKWRERNGGTSADLFTSAVELELAGAARHHDPGIRRQADEVLLRALLADLRTGQRLRGLSPWRRRRRTRFVFLVPRLGAQDARERGIVRDFPDAVRQTRCTAAFLIGAGPPWEVGGPSTDVDGLGAANDDLRHWPLRTPADTGDDAEGGVLVVRLDGQPDPTQRWPRSGPQGRTGRIRVKRHPAWSPWAEAVCAGAAALLTVSLLGWRLVPVVSDALDASCAGGMPSGTAPARADLNGVPAQNLYESERKRIDAQNQLAERAGRRGEPVRTIVHLGASVPEDSTTAQISSGALPELRGIAMAQEQANDEAAEDSKKVWLKVREVDAGARFVRGQEAAQEIVRAAAQDKGIVGVVGLGQSRPGTVAAIKTLGAAGIPMVGTTATADSMLAINNQYIQVAPKDEREGLIAAGFARNAKTVQTGQDACVKPSSALVVQDPVDLYSKDLGEDFTRHYERDGGSVHTVWYHPGGQVDEPSAEEDPDTEWEATIDAVARNVCGRLEHEPHLAVYWASRAAEFGGFLTDFQSRTSCSGRWLTVIGGNDLTNSVINAQKITLGRPWLRLYHTAHAAPATEQRSKEGLAPRFTALYANRYGPDDPWRDDGHPALAWDAFAVLSGAIDQAYQATSDKDFDRGTVLAEMLHGVGGTDGIQGVTGALNFSGGAEVPPDKPLLIRYVTGQGGRTVLACGVFTPGGPLGQWGPGNRYDCPQGDGE